MVPLYTSDLELVVLDSVRLQKRTKHLYSRACQDFVRFAGGERSGVAVEKWRDAMAARRLSPSTINTRLMALRWASRRLVDLGLAQHDFARAAELLRPSQAPPRRALTLDDGRRLVATCSGTSPRDLRDRAIITLALRTGMRREGLATAQIDQLVGNALTFANKGGNTHTVYLDDETTAVLSDWLAWLKTKGVTTGAIFRTIVGPTVADTYVVGDALSGSGIYLIIRSRADAAGLKVHPHQLRHTCVSWLRAQGVPDWRIARLTGHRNLRTVDHYTHDIHAATDPIGNTIPPLSGWSGGLR